MPKHITISACISRRLSLFIKTLLLCLLLTQIVNLSAASDLDEVLQLKSNEDGLNFWRTGSLDLGSRHLLDHEREDDHKEDDHNDHSKHHKSGEKEESQLHEVILVK